MKAKINIFRLKIHSKEENENWLRAQSKSVGEEQNTKKKKQLYKFSYSADMPARKNRDQRYVSKVLLDPDIWRALSLSREGVLKFDEYLTNKCTCG